MKRHRLLMPLLGLVLIAGGLLAGQSPERADLDAIYLIKNEGFERSQVMEVTSYLTDIYGPRLTNSPNIKAAAKWTTGKMTEWGLTNVTLVPRLGPKQRRPARATGLRRVLHPDLNTVRTCSELRRPTLAMSSSLVSGWSRASPMSAIKPTSSGSVSCTHLSQALFGHTLRERIAAV